LDACSGQGQRFFADKPPPTSRGRLTRTENWLGAVDEAIRQRPSRFTRLKSIWKRIVPGSRGIEVKVSLRANRAVIEPYGAGFDQKRIGVATLHAEGQGKIASTAPDSYSTSAAVDGAATGLDTPTGVGVWRA
jgi:hypothetical protein